MKRADYLPLMLGKTMGAYYHDRVPQDVRQWAVYAAEESLEPGATFADEAAARSFLDRILASDTWHQHFPAMTDIELIVKTPGDGDAVTFSAAAPSTTDPLGSATIWIHTRMMNEMVLLHELAHCVQPRYLGEIKQPKNKDPEAGLPSDASGHGHDTYFQATFVWLCEQFGTTDTHHQLREAYVHFGHPAASEESLWEMQQRTLYWTPLEVLRSATILSRLEQDRAEFTAAFPQLAEKAAQRRQEFEEQRPPGTRFGGLFWDLRDFCHRVSKKRVAEIISRVVPCKTSDLTRLERLEHPPETEKDARLAVYYAVALGADPSWARTAFGVTRFHPKVPMSDLIKINRPWVLLVRRLNRMLRERQPYWTGAGPR
ncbi:hypothetical protein [Arthrobacter sp. HMWF013]|uniref:hypothetical protein n=1 Tax=Arthrobacter sp. HMWF013 TaxID=2056849 RepID=UPI000D35328E|nr:hypothetical protein [Arthrobacter sp. HMWF013]PTT60040.1 hypothetical protein DBR22_21175 [Arthrobacter sp. HMWF013]